ncbi:carbohydrate ABC transporter permease [uncultured Sphaerochaeta sp.]|uniref:carbohydrate ABC transporter permease n=1 Tax=uncultured Sphaerochaeta sp. TaxID=886478 RepID=UPI002A0A60F5|nr:carbohydrate ABC transporter permease [uncultured Sphaerochaeta sp.]
MKKALPVLTMIFALIVVFPIFYSLSGSLFSPADFSSTPARLFPTTLTFSNYTRAFAQSHLTRFFVNSFITATFGTLLRMTISILAAYSFSFLSFKGRDFLFIVIIATMLLPGDALLIENFTTIRHWGLLDTYLGIISTSLLAPVHIFMLRQYFKTVSKEYREEAILEGCTDKRFIVSLLLPLSKSVLIILALQSFTGIFNDYLWPLLVTNKESMRTVQVGITMLGFSETLDFGPEFAAISVLMSPILITFILLRKRIQESLSTRFTER